MLCERLNRKISQINGLFNSLLSANHVTSGDRATLSAMAERLRSDNPKITAVGRYQSIPIWKQSIFEQELVEAGLDGLVISDLVNNIQVLSPERKIAMPITLIEPATFELLPVVGTDLAADNQLQLTLSSAIAQNSIVTKAIPADWPAAGQLMVIQPSYRGLYVPEKQSERIQQTDGGYFLIINPQVFLDGIMDEHPLDSLDNLSLVLRKFSEDTSIASRQLPMKGLFAKDWFESPHHQSILELGDASLVLSIEGIRGIPRNNLIAAVGFISLAIAFSVSAYLWLHERRSLSIEKSLSHDALRAERDRAARTLHLISDAVITVNRKCDIQHVNTVGMQFLGYTLNELINKPLDNFLFLRYRDPPSDIFYARQCLNDMRSDELIALDLISVTPETNIALETGTRAFRGTVSLNEGSSEYPATAVFVFRDMSVENKLTAALEYQARHDALTGCANRHHFESQLSRLFEDLINQSADNALLYIDLDRFKVVNDTAGHVAGDMMLVHLTKELYRILDSSDTLARLGGDEFSILMNNVSLDMAAQKAKQVHTLFQTMVFHYQDRGYPIRASLGLAHFSEAGSSPSEVMAAADIACYTAKDLGRNQLCIYHADDVAIARRTSELWWLSLLRQALEDNRFQLYAQPLVCMRDPERFARYEFLLRLADEEGNDLQAFQIIKAAERYGMMLDIDRWVIDNAFSIIAKHEKSEQHGSLVFAINLSGQSAADSTLINYINDRILHHRVDPKCLCFEITETAAISHFANAVAFSQAIRGLGATIALDDFGSGHSSFAYLKNLSIDVLKIDGQFIKDIASNPVDQAMVEAIRYVAHSMQITTVAEFVESQEIFEILTDIGIDFAQGYYIGRPMPIGELLPTTNVFSDHLMS